MTKTIGKFNKAKKGMLLYREEGGRWEGLLPIEVY